VIDANQTHFPLHEFLACLNVFLALFRSEGYGLNLMEATQVGLTVVATGWTPAPDIAARPDIRTVGYRLVVPLDPQHTYEKFDGALGAEPDLSQAAKLLQELKVSWRKSAHTPRKGEAPFDE